MQCSSYDLPIGIKFVEIKAETDKANQKVCKDRFLPSLVLRKVIVFVAVGGLCFLGVPAPSYCPAKTHGFQNQWIIGELNTWFRCSTCSLKLIRLQKGRVDVPGPNIDP